MNLALLLARRCRQVPRIVLATTLTLVAAACASATRAAQPEGATPAAPSRTHQARLVTPARSSSPRPHVRAGLTHFPAIAKAECTTSGLKITFINNQDAAGQAYDDLDFTNSSRTTCYVEGWPGVSYAKAARGRLVGAPAQRVPGRSRKVVLVPGATAHAPLTFGDSASNTPAECGTSVSADWLRIYPPDQYSPAFVPLGFSIQACSRAQFWIGTLEARPARSY